MMGKHSKFIPPKHKKGSAIPVKNAKEALEKLKTEGEKEQDERMNQEMNHLDNHAKFNKPKPEKTEGEKEQDERIKENLRGVNRDFTGMSYQEFEDLFEDRDPFEFL